MGRMSLHGNPIHENAHLPHGGEVQVFVGMLEDPYIADENIDTVVLELRVGGNVVASVETVLSADQVSEATELARQVAAGLRSGELEPHASSIEPLADELR
jgi:hypothetical protein